MSNQHQYTSWSGWQWNNDAAQYWRARLNPDGAYEYEYSIDPSAPRNEGVDHLAQAFGNASIDDTGQGQNYATHTGAYGGGYGYSSMVDQGPGTGGASSTVQQQQYGMPPPQGYAGPSSRKGKNVAEPSKPSKHKSTKQKKGGKSSDDAGYGATDPFYQPPRQPSTSSSNRSNERQSGYPQQGRHTGYHQDQYQRDGYQQQGDYPRDSYQQQGSALPDEDPQEIAAEGESTDYSSGLEPGFSPTQAQPEHDPGQLDSGAFGNTYGDYQFPQYPSQAGSSSEHPKSSKHAHGKRKVQNTQEGYLDPSYSAQETSPDLGDELEPEIDGYATGVADSPDDQEQADAYTYHAAEYRPEHYPNEDDDEGDGARTPTAVSGGPNEQLPYNPIYPGGAYADPASASTFPATYQPPYQATYQDPYGGDYSGASYPSHFAAGDDTGRIATSGHTEELDHRYVIEPSTRFSPGEVFKVLWPEPLGSGGRIPNENLTEIEERNHMGQKFYVGIRRFIVVANDEGHCTCVPILTYERRGCTKKGVKANKHGIVYPFGGRPHLLKNEPNLGFDPVRLDLDSPAEKLARESRVNYSKLVTIEHNVKVFFIGRIIRDDFEIVTHAVDKCWADKSRKGGESSSRKSRR